MTNSLQKLRQQLLDNHTLTPEIEDMLTDLEIENMQKFKYSKSLEHVNKKLLPLRSTGLEVTSGSGVTNHLINSNSLDALHTLANIKKTYDVLFMGLTDETLIFNGEAVPLSDVDLDNKWYTYIENRVRLMKKLMGDKSIVFVTVDDNRLAETKLIMDKILNVKNYVSTMIWHKPDSTPHNKFLNRTKEYVLVYKSINLEGFRRKESDSGPEVSYNKLDRTRKYRSDYDYAIPVPDTEDEYAYAGGNKEDWDARQIGKHNEYDWKWMLIKEEFENRLANGHIKFEKDKKEGFWKVYNAFYTGNDQPYSDFVEAPTYSKGKNQVEDMFQKMSKRNTKPTEFYKHLIHLHPEDNVSVLDTTGETATVGQAVLEMNASQDTFKTVTTIAESEFDGYDVYFAYERLKKIIVGYQSLKTGKDVAGLGSNLNVYTLEQKNSENQENLFNSVISLRHNMTAKKEVTENLEKYEDAIGNSVFVLSSTIMDNTYLREKLESEINLKFMNDVYIPISIKNPPLSKELLSIGMNNPKIKEMALKV